MSYPELQHLSDLHDRWVAIDPRGGTGLFPLRSGAVVVDHDEEIDELCRRITAEHKTSLTIVFCGRRPRA